MTAAVDVTPNWYFEEFEWKTMLEVSLKFLLMWVLWA